MQEKRLKVLIIPAGYPSEVNPVAGTFVKDHAKAASLYNDVVILYSYIGIPNLTLKNSISDKSEDGIRTIRIRYGDILAYLFKRFKKGKLNKVPSSDSDGKTNLADIIITNLKTIVMDLFYYWSLLTAFHVLVKEWKPNVIHAHGFYAGVPAVFIGYIYNIPVIISEHWSGFPLHKLTMFDLIKARFAMNRASAILPVTDNLKENIESYGIKNKFYIVPNPVNTKLFCPLLKSLSTNGKKRILFVGRLTPIKGLTYLIESLSQLRTERDDFIIDIIGDGEYKEEYEKRAEQMGLSDVVIFHGFKPKEIVANYMQNCDFYVQSSLWENLPCVLIESMACGKPIVATDVGGVKEMLPKQNGLLIPPKDIDALKDAMRIMLNNYKDYSCQNIAKYADDKFSYNVVGDQLNEIYRSINEREPVKFN